MGAGYLIGVNSAVSVVARLLGELCHIIKKIKRKK